MDFIKESDEHYAMLADWDAYNASCKICRACTRYEGRPLRVTELEVAFQAHWEVDLESGAVTGKCHLCNTENDVCASNRTRFLRRVRRSESTLSRPGLSQTMTARHDCEGR